MLPLPDALEARADDRSPAFVEDGLVLGWDEVTARVSGLARALDPAHRTIGLLAPNGVAWAVAQLAALWAGRTIVPLPTFFTAAQLGHVVRDASVDCILATPGLIGRAEGSGIATRLLDISATAVDVPFAEGFAQVIYTSGSTGTPKGVRHGSGQIEWMASALREAVSATPEDRYLSVLPLPLLLETLCAILVPLLAGAEVRFEPRIAEGLGTGSLSGLAAAFAKHRPTLSVLVPQVLGGWIGELEATRTRAPDSLRLVAVGGAPVPTLLADRAEAVGIPVCEGYGLSECGSVVTLNRPDRRRRGSVGRALPGLAVTVEQGEILVDGPSVMDGYLGSARPPGPWRTGDLGAIDTDGFVYVHGRKDNLIVLSSGRNVSPEWVETMLLQDPYVGACGVAGHGADRLTAVIVPTPAGELWFDVAHPDEQLAFVRGCCAGVPDHAVPGRCLVISPGDAVASGLLTSNGRIARVPLRDLVARRA